MITCYSGCTFYAKKKLLIKSRQMIPILKQFQLKIMHSVYPKVLNSFLFLMHLHPFNVQTDNDLLNLKFLLLHFFFVFCSSKFENISDFLTMLNALQLVLSGHLIIIKEEKYKKNPPTFCHR
jgi:hypothetical protein